jgi:hypothetical protein
MSEARAKQLKMTGTAPPPRLDLEPCGCRPAAQASEWLAAWRVRNAGDEVVTLIETWLPHGRFRWGPRKLDPVIRLRPRAAVQIEQPVRCLESAGTVVENTFLILRVTARGRPWRVLARHRVEWDATGPRPICELITTQPVGFSSTARAGPP